MDVIEGSSLLLQCVVGNQRGPVQWAKDGFVLGYDRSIPGYPRYSMIGDPSQGVHNLRIVDAKSEDNGEFQCQVGNTCLLRSPFPRRQLTVFPLTLGWPRRQELRSHPCYLQSDRPK